MVGMMAGWVWWWRRWERKRKQESWIKSYSDQDEDDEDQGEGYTTRYIDASRQEAYKLSGKENEWQSHDRLETKKLI